MNIDPPKVVGLMDAILTAQATLVTAVQWVKRDNSSPWKTILSNLWSLFLWYIHIYPIYDCREPTVVDLLLERMLKSEYHFNTKPWKKVSFKLTFSPPPSDTTGLGKSLSQNGWLVLNRRWSWTRRPTRQKTNFRAFLQLLPPGAMECVCKPRGRLLLQIVQNAPRRDKTTHWGMLSGFKSLGAKQCWRSWMKYPILNMVLSTLCWIWSSESPRRCLWSLLENTSGWFTMR